jgi:hypothetical protein
MSPPPPEPGSPADWLRHARSDLYVIHYYSLSGHATPHQSSVSNVRTWVA